MVQTYRNYQFFAHFIYRNMPFERFSINSTSFTFFLCNFLVAFIGELNYFWQLFLPLNTFVIITAIGQILTYSYRIPGRHKSRRQTNLTYTCEASCDAQFSQDFEVSIIMQLNFWRYDIWTLDDWTQIQNFGLYIDKIEWLFIYNTRYANCKLNYI